MRSTLDYEHFIVPHRSLLCELRSIREKALRDAKTGLTQCEFDAKRYFLKLSDMFSEIVLALFDSFQQTARQNLPSRLAVALAGGLSRRVATTKSDIDLVVLHEHGNSTGAREFAAFLRVAFTEIGFSNSDVILYELSPLGWQQPPDVIDQHMGLTSSFLLGARSLHEDLITRTATINRFWQVMVEKAILRHASIPPEAPISILKYRKGGLREAANLTDLIQLAFTIGVVEVKGRSISRLAEVVRLCERALRVAAELAEHPERLREEVSWIMSRLRHNNETCNVVEECCRAVVMAYDEFLRDIPRIGCPFDWSLYEAIELKLSTGCHFNRREYRRLITADLSGLLRPLAVLGLRADGAEFVELVREAQLPKGVANLATALNPLTPPDVLHALALLPGYNWRNIRDQVLKNPNVHERTLQLLAKSESGYTRRRALAAIESRSRSAMDIDQ